MDQASNSAAAIAGQRAPFGIAWRYGLSVLALCFVLSTEVLFIPANYENWTLSQIADGWREQFADIASLGLFTTLLVAAADRLIPPDKRWRLPALVAVVIAAIGSGYGALTLFHFPAGYYPPAFVLISETLRLIVPGVLAMLVWAIRRQNIQATQRIQELELQRATIERRLLEAQLKLMEAQIEPHFLLNTLATLKYLCQSGADSGERMLASLLLYLGAALPRFRDEHTTLATECALIGAYLDILHMRMGPRLRFAIELPPALANHTFPPMILITLVENAIKHGLTPSPEGGRIEISARLQGEALEVSVSDDGVGFQSSSGSGIGLVNIRARLRALYGAAASLKLEQSEPHGVRASVTIPYEERTAPMPALATAAASGSVAAAPETLHAAATGPSMTSSTSAISAENAAGAGPGAPPAASHASLRARLPHILLLGFAITAMDELRALPIDLDNGNWLHSLQSGMVIACNSLSTAFTLIASITLAERSKAPPRWRPALLTLVVCLASPLAGGIATIFSYLFNWLSFTGQITDYRGLFAHLLWTALAIGAPAAAWYTVWGRAQGAEARLWRTQLEYIHAEQQMVEARLSMMKARVEPSFLIREIATIRRLYHDDDGAALQQLDLLIAYLHAALPRLRGAPATLGEELQLAGAYLRLQERAWQGRLRWHLDSTPQAQQLRFPPLSVLPLLADALRRAALHPATSPRLHVRLQIESQSLRVTVEDNCPAMPRDHAAELQHEQAFHSYFGPGSSVARDSSSHTTRIILQANIRQPPERE